MSHELINKRISGYLYWINRKCCLTTWKTPSGGDDILWVICSKCSFVSLLSDHFFDTLIGCRGLIQHSKTKLLNIFHGCTIYRKIRHVTHVVYPNLQRTFNLAVDVHLVTQYLSTRRFPSPSKVSKIRTWVVWFRVALTNQLKRLQNPNSITENKLLFDAIGNMRIPDFTVRRRLRVSDEKIKFEWGRGRRVVPHSHALQVKRRF